MMYYGEFIKSYNEYDYDSAHKALISELACILLKNKKDFVILLNESGIDAKQSDSNERLIDLFFENIDTNKRLVLGASILVSVYNKELSDADGRDVESDVVKACYKIIEDEYCNSDIIRPSNALNAAVLNIRADKKSSFIDSEQKKKNGSNEMKLALEKESNLERLQGLKKEADEKAERQKKQVVAFVVIFSTLLIAGLYIKNGKK